jgi:arsenate reductase
MKIAFVCNGNSFKSLVAERFGKEFNDGTFEIYSAGTNPAGKINEMGKEIMEKRGLSMEGYSPKPMDTLPEKIDILVKMGCDIECPTHQANRVLDFGLQDMTDQEEIVEALGKKVGSLLNTLKIGILADAEAKAKKLLEETKDTDC